MREEFRRSELLLGPQALERLAGAHAAVFGVGGVGGHAAEALARAGVGSLTLFDSDTVALSNINRQIAATHATLGQYKVDVMAARIRDINPQARVTCMPVFYTVEDAPKYSLSEYDCIVDAIDTVAQKLQLAAWCQERGYREISAMGGGNKLDPTRLRFARIEETVNCPLARVMRKECRRRGIHDLQVLYSDEQPVRMEKISDEQWRESGSLLGTMSYFPPIMGQMIASRVIRDLLGWA